LPLFLFLPVIMSLWVPPFNFPWSSPNIHFTLSGISIVRRILPLFFFCVLRLFGYLLCRGERTCGVEYSWRRFVILACGCFALAGLLCWSKIPVTVTVVPRSFRAAKRAFRRAWARFYFFLHAFFFCVDSRRQIMAMCAEFRKILTAAMMHGIGLQ